MINPVQSMYIHVPFCKSICAYCDFTRVGCHDGLIDKWLNALEKELLSRSISSDIKTIYIGGGTPTSLNELQLERLLSLLDGISENVVEYTIEVNPETLSEKKVELLVQHGINRISIGVQAIQSHLLSMMNRSHTWQQVTYWIDIFRKKGIENISLDAMYSLPEQTIDDWINTLNAFIELRVPHISLYSLTIEENSLFKKQGKHSLDEETEAAMYFAACEQLKKAGYEHYEISNFCLPEKASMHNQTYWHYDDFYGIGLGASGKENHQRYDNTCNFEIYFHNPLSKEIISLTVEDEMFEMVMMNLRLKEGMSLSLFKERFKNDFTEIFKDALSKAIKNDWLKFEEDRVLCTEKGYPILNTVLELFL